MEKMTKKDVFTMLLAVDGVKNEPMFVEFINHELELLAKKSSSKSVSKAEKEKRAENEGLKDLIVQVLRENGTCSISEMRAKNEQLFPLSSSKISALLTQLRADGVVERAYDKKTAVFSLIWGVGGFIPHSPTF